MNFSHALRAMALMFSPLLSLAEKSICRGDCAMGENGVKECTFTMKVDVFAGPLGYYTVEECGEGRNPTLGIEHGVHNKFIQTDVSNYYHPLGLAYYVDGAHDEVDELEPGIMGDNNSIGSTCVDTLSCPAPMYFKNGEYLGTYSNDASVLDVTTGKDNFGLDDYEPLFFFPLPAWTEEGKFHVSLKYDEPSFTKDIFYFCHIHHGMSGIIKFIDSDGNALNTEQNILETSDYYTAEVSGFDKTCGTFNVTDYKLPNNQCPERFVCDVPEGNPELTQFSQCVEAMDCHMVTSMINKVSAGDERALFLHQMVPHHQNAVNMAKSLMKSGSLDCDDIMNEDNADCQLEVIVREIVNAQNFQIQAMNGILEANDWPLYDDCKVAIE